MYHIVITVKSYALIVNQLTDSTYRVAINTDFCRRLFEYFPLTSLCVSLIQEALISLPI